ncbi:class I adenylate-forming enzyme family protein [Nocardioides pacificus]
MRTRDRFRQLLDEAPGDADAIEYDEQWTTWGTLQQIGRDLERELTARGLGESARVGVILENTPEHVAVLVALIGSGRCVVTLSPLQPPQRLAADIAASELPAVVGSTEALARPGVAAAVTSGGVLELSRDGVHSTGPLVERAPAASDSSPGVVVEMLTSGTTGPPKRVLLGERQFDTALATSVPAPPEGKLFRSGVTLVVTPLVHIGGFWGALGPVYAGRRVSLMAKFSLEPWLRAVVRHRPRATGLVPAALRSILRAEVSPAQLESLQVITTGTTFCPPELIDEMFEAYGIRVLPTYGATEFAGAVAMWTYPLHEKYWATKAGSAGRALPGVSLRVTDADGAVLSAGEMGHLEIRSKQTPVGEHEWLRTSDLAEVDTDGFLWIRGRADDAIIRGGFKVHPDHVRSVLEKHPSVREAAVAPRADERLGQVPVAGVELEPGQPVPDEAELVAHCRETLTPYEVPVSIVVLDELPRTPSSKVSRVDLLERIEESLTTRVPV